MQDNIEVQSDFYRGICVGLSDDLARLLEYLPKSKRGSNIQRVLDSMKVRLDAARDAMERPSDVRHAADREQSGGA
ncbi:hypothetical protein ACLRDC_16500 [Gluconacetobacter sacchari]|uniref:Uncharacterized protein n=1 Tax=Gluconacetobacter sacchari TaxID=92759 RepID=A0A7W4IGR7_9PROT|nr:hypothetical protein [Gluconacetobacter sacchari]MBB2162563.1 hypothetical protein [Gluconacetobacter sacchari]